MYFQAGTLRKGGMMSRKGFTPEQIIHKLRQAEAELSPGQSTVQGCKNPGVTEQTCYRWGAKRTGASVSDRRSTGREPGRHEVGDKARDRRHPKH